MLLERFLKLLEAFCVLQVLKEFKRREKEKRVGAGGGGVVARD